METNPGKKKKAPESEFRKPFSACHDKRIALSGIAVKNLWRRFGEPISFA
jgi:hypothetical protein